MPDYRVNLLFPVVPLALIPAFPPMVCSVARDVDTCVRQVNDTKDRLVIFLIRRTCVLNLSSVFQLAGTKFVIGFTARRYHI